MENFNKKKLKVSDVVPKKWFTIDNIEQLKIYKKKEECIMIL